MAVDRKGIFQEYGENGTVLSDERWQMRALADGTLFLENETVRLAPFDEPRSDSLTIMLDPQGRLLEWSIHGLFGQRESRICVIGAARKEATVCWRHLGDVHEKRLAWNDADELDWNTPLCNMLTVRRLGLGAGQSRAFDCWYLDPVTFAPSRMRQIYANHGREPHETRLGTLPLWHYTMDFGATGASISQLWFDDDGVCHDFRTRFGGFRLVAGDVLSLS